MDTRWNAWRTLAGCLVLPLAVLAAAPASAQAPSPEVVAATRVGTSVPLAAMRPAPLAPYRGEGPFVVPNQFMRFNGFPADGQAPAEDGAVDRGAAVDLLLGGASGTTLLSFEGMSADAVQAATGGRGAPPDPSGAVGPNHYVQMVNSATTIYNRAGGTVVATFPNNQFWVGLGGVCETTNRGDPIVLYDAYADRWLVSQFAFTSVVNGTYAMCVAVSATADPTGAYHQYEFPWANFPDYPKLGVWRDAYTMMITTFKASDTAFLYSEAVVLERNQMLQGLPATSIRFNTTNTGTAATLGYGVLPSDADGGLPPAGTPAYFIDRVAANSIDLFALTPNWTTPASSTFERLGRLPTAAYTARGSLIPQPGTATGLDVLSGHNMFRLQYRDRGTHGTLLFNHDVDVAGQAGSRWYELRDGGTNTWSVYQQGTYVPADGHHRWMGSVAMNGNGDIGLAYSVSSSTLFPSLRFTGQTASASGTGLMNVPETVIHAGGGSQTNPTRWGDYHQLSVDPTDDTRFWFTGEYYAANGSFDWTTRVAQFEIIGEPPVVAVAPSSVSLTLGAGEADTRTVTVSNTAAPGAGALTVAAAIANLTSRDGTPVPTPVSAPAAAAVRAATASPGATAPAARKDAPDAAAGTGVALRAGGPDAFGYTFADSSEPGGPAFAWVDIAATGTAVALGDDALSAAVPLPFAFPFYGADQTQVFIGSNGYLSFNPSPTTGDGLFTNQSLPSAADPDHLVAMYWDDLNPATGGTVRYQDMGDGRFVVSFLGVPHFNIASEASTFQAILYPSGQIVLQYLSMTDDASDPNSHTIGIENADGSDGLSVVFNAAYVQNNLAVRVTPPATPWATVAPSTLTVAPGASGALTLTFDAAALTEGTYTADLVLTTNDPATPTVTVPLTLTVGGTAQVAGAAGWRQVAAPAQGVTVDDLAAMNLVQGVPGYYPPPAAQPNLFTGYDGAAYVPSSGAGEVLAPGRGAFWYFYDTDFNPGGPSQSRALPTALATTRPAVTTDTDVTLHAAGNGSNLLGNPFGVSLDVSGVGTWPGAAARLSSFVVQTWNPAAGSYVTSVTRPTFAPWQGFWAEASAAGALTIPAAARTTGGTFVRPPAPPPTLAFELSTPDGALRDEAAVVRFVEGAEAGADVWDAAKRTPAASAFVTLAAGAADGALRAVESLPAPEGALAVVPLHVRSVGAGPELVLTWPGVSSLPSAWAVLLRDAATGRTVDLRRETAYAFRVEPEAARGALSLGGVEARQGAARFELVVGPAGLVAAESGPASVLALAPPFPNPVSEQAQVSFSLAAAGAARLSVFDALGREVAVLAEGDLAAGAHTRTVRVGRLASGVYVLRLSAGGQVLTQRVTVTR